MGKRYILGHFMKKCEFWVLVGMNKIPYFCGRVFVDIALNVTKDSGQMQNVKGKLINRKCIGIVT